MSARINLNVLRSTPIEKLHREFHMYQNCIRLIEKPADSCVCGADHCDICDCIDCMRSVHFSIDGDTTARVSALQSSHGRPKVASESVMTHPNSERIRPDVP